MKDEEKEDENRKYTMGWKEHSNHDPSDWGKEDEEIWAMKTLPRLHKQEKEKRIELWLQ